VLPLDLDLASLYRATLTSLVNGDTDKFHKNADAAMKRDPNDPRALALSYRRALSERDVDQAVDSLNRLYDLFKKSPPAMGTIGFDNLDESRIARIQVAFWKGVLAMPVSAGKAPVTVHAFAGDGDHPESATQLSGSGDFSISDDAMNL
jgi:hypothetical protein